MLMVKRNSPWAILILFVCNVYILLLFTNPFYQTDQFENRDILKHTIFYPTKEVRLTTRKIILLWTPMFFSWQWDRYVREGLKGCPNMCEVTMDKTRIKEADAVVFHIYDMWFWLGMPNYRDPSQVWVVWGAEPTTRLWKDYHWYRNNFNWTMMYRLDSTIYAPFGRIKPLNETEKKINQEYFNTKSLFKQRNKLMAVTNSDCYDEVQRYRLIHELGKHIQIDFYGRCGNLSCPRFSRSCAEKLSKYKFMVQFENSYCKDYISEKFWVAINKSQIPIVNWKPTQKDALIRNSKIPNNSYINIFDFPNIKMAADYIKKVAADEALYNSYFDWRMDYKTVDIGIWKQFCHLCWALSDRNIPAQAVKNLQKWIDDDTCSKGIPWSFLERRINRHLFEWGF